MGAPDRHSHERFQDLTREHEWFKLLRDPEGEHQVDSVSDGTMCVVLNQGPVRAYPRYLVTYDAA